MTKPYHIVIVGAGPAGLATALALLQTPTPTPEPAPLKLTLLELRPTLQPLGGAVHLTPLALRYLDHIGAGAALRDRAAACRTGVEVLSHARGGSLGTLWPGADAVRVRRTDLVEVMMARLKDLAADGDADMEVVFGARIASISETGDGEEGPIRISYAVASPSAPESGLPVQTGECAVLEADILVGCDGLHSQVRTTYVEPARPKVYSGKCAAYGYTAPSSPPTESPAASTWLRPDGKPLLQDTSLISKGHQSLLMSYFTPDRDSLYVAAVLPLADEGSPPPVHGAAAAPSAPSSAATTRSAEGWAVRGADKAGLKREIKATFAGGGLACLGEVIDRCDDWFFYPVYILPGGGAWSRGRAILIGDAAHGMPPQGESTGLAIEDGILLAHVLSRRHIRAHAQLLADYTLLRRADIDAAYTESTARWGTSTASATPRWLMGVFMDWITWAYLSFMAYRTNYFGRDVRELTLPE